MKAQQLKDELLFLVDEDTAAFNKVMAAFGLPKDSAEEKAARSTAIQKANKYAAEIPLRGDGNGEPVLRTAGGNGRKG